MGGFGEVLPYHDNKVSLDPVRQDKWSLPVLAMAASIRENELAMREDVVASVVLRRRGAKNVGI